MSEDQKPADTQTAPAEQPAGDTPPATGLSVGDLQNLSLIHI